MDLALDGRQMIAVRGHAHHLPFQQNIPARTGAGAKYLIKLYLGMDPNSIRVLL
jgi:hypothetical protein